MLLLCNTPSVPSDKRFSEIGGVKEKEKYLRTEKKTLSISMYKVPVKIDISISLIFIGWRQRTENGDWLKLENRLSDGTGKRPETAYRMGRREYFLGELGSRTYVEPTRIYPKKQ